MTEPIQQNYKQFSSDKIWILKTVLYSTMRNNLNESLDINIYQEVNILQIKQIIIIRSFFLFCFEIRNVETSWGIMIYYISFTQFQNLNFRPTELLGKVFSFFLIELCIFYICYSVKQLLINKVFSSLFLHVFRKKKSLLLSEKTIARLFKKKKKKNTKPGSRIFIFHVFIYLNLHLKIIYE